MAVYCALDYHFSVGWYCIIPPSRRMIVTAAWRRNNSWGTLIDLLCGYRVITSMENIKLFLITSIEIINISTLHWGFFFHTVITKPLNFTSSVSFSFYLSFQWFNYLFVCMYFLCASVLSTLEMHWSISWRIVILYTSEHSILFGNRKMTLNYF